MIPLGFYSVCLRAEDLEKTVSFYRALGFTSVGEDAPGLRISLAYRAHSLTFMSFLQDNLINFRGAHIHRLKECMKEINVPITLFEEFKSEERLMLDDHGNPLPDNECGSFSIEDPTGHEFFFNTHREEREPYELALRRPSPTSTDTPFLAAHRPALIYTLDVRDIAASRRFFESIGLAVTVQGERAWIYPPPTVGDTQFIFQLRQGETKRVSLSLEQSALSAETLQELGLTATDPSSESWTGHDPDGRELTVNRC